ncbi:hypothetical protein KM317_13420 [Xanthomonas translucens pv. arrhenatheri]|uniref:hypothetical protein n=3 Tax=Xanthomonas graminis TaxID=3390026 RepID=UPI001F279E21|nr:hypothetical protein [Xanthomonas translucens]UKE76468.1 hypothetical protein KM317_13420 [Xanthomonas translucens pv. arrhenatheri]
MAVDVDTDKWNLLEKAHDFRAQLRLLGFVLLADVVLVLSTGTNVWNLRWSTVSDRPAAIVLVVLAYGAIVKIVVPLLLPLLRSVIGLLVEWIQRIPGISPERRDTDSPTYVTWTDADRWLADAPDVNRPGFPRHLAAIIRSSKRGVYEQQAIHARVQGRGGQAGH